MSDTSEETIQSDRNGENHESVCRDFTRGLCDRKFCKYKHENEIKQLNFCHDFQNFVCPRPFCKFIHCTLEEVDEYKRTGQMSHQILTEATRKHQLPGTPPVCNQFKKGQCRRAVCKYRHITKEQEEAEIVGIVQNGVQKTPPQVIFSNNNGNGLAETQLVALESLGGVLRRNGVSFDEYKEEGIPLIKRRFIATQEPEIICDIMDRNGTGSVFKGYFSGNPPPAMLSRADARTLMLEEENQMLHKEIAQLKKQVSDLTATNEFLLDQNANLRVSGKRNNVPAVTITNTPTQVNRTVIASVATVPVSLATVSTCNPVSGNHSVSIAGCPAVSMAPAQILANSQQILVTTNPTTQLALANSSQHQLAIANSSQAQLAIAQQSLATNLAAAQQAQPQLTTSQAQQLALATTTQQLTSQAQHMANQQMALASAAAGGPQLTTQTQQITLASNAQAQQLALAAGTNQQLTSQAQQLALASTTQQLTSQAQQLALASTTQQLTSQAQQLALANTTQQLTSQAQQLALASTNQQLNNQAQQLTVTNVPQQLTLASTNQQLNAQLNLASEIHRNSQMNAISTSQAIAMSNSAPQSMVSYPIMTHSINHGMTH
ncbi:unnamed protein product [Psylliodes chrysocephalus]|uniref:C3H1-type domain-containing protein n=1 Tax=Psylliodes chrysocephalus TaxID=3402493 RepID=A0A9P0GCG5_9CUCU|nr:unnamed protein product [Psylliodes chrysocephala]